MACNSLAAWLANAAGSCHQPLARPSRPQTPSSLLFPLLLPVPLPNTTTNNCRYNEISLYNYASPGFTSGAGHFTQVVWAATTQLGCGVSTCTSNSPFGASFPTWTLVVW